MSKYKKAYEKLKRDYQLAVATTDTLNHYSPIKKVRVLNSIHGVPSITMTEMHGLAIDGYSVYKTICVNDELCLTDDDVILDDKQHHVIKEYHNQGLTRLRCGLMSCVALEEGMKLLNLKEVKRIGFIGNGKANIQNAQCIHDIFGFDDIVIRGSAKHRGKNKEEYEKIGCKVTVDDSDDYHLLNQCDVIISCTSTCNKEDQISSTQLNKPKLFIALDTGYLLDESFRKDCEAFSDDVPQLNAYYDEEFIFDKEKVQLKQLMKDKEIKKDRICIYMFGISFADAEVAEMLYRHQLELNNE